ncbi:MAG: GYD domain-containing protein [Nitrososphaeraceae archaeon]|nr:GYD domain-containing protein [Nitrososphaeraceae archaeon]MBV9667380.1 GYD domain-containing protein [Nitrososphaeraceae archaeon]
MPDYVILVNWTDQGIENVKDSVRPAEAFQSEIQKAGGKSIGLYYTLGKYDIVDIV